MVPLPSPCLPSFSCHLNILHIPQCMNYTISKKIISNYLNFFMHSEMQKATDMTAMFVSCFSGSINFWTMQKLLKIYTKVETQKFVNITSTLNIWYALVNGQCIYTLTIYGQKCLLCQNWDCSQSNSEAKFTPVCFLHLGLHWRHLNAYFKYNVSFTWCIICLSVALH